MLAEGGVGVDDLREWGRRCLRQRHEDPQAPSGRSALAVRGRDRCLGEVLERDSEEKPGFLDARARGMVSGDLGEEKVDDLHGDIVPPGPASGSCTWTSSLYYQEMITVHHGECLAHLRSLEPESVDAIVTDSPYGLGSPPPILDVLRAWLAGDEYRPKGRGFMGHAWDAFVPGPEVWRECLRVLKPGGHLLAFFGSRTVDVGGLAIRLAGFEIRDSLCWLYGTGFPKSLDVSKAIDKVRDDSEDVRKICRWLRARMEERCLTSKDIADLFDFHPRMVDHWAARDTDSQPTLPTLEQWDSLRTLLGFPNVMDHEVLRLNLRKGQPGEAWADRPITGTVEEWTNRSTYALTSRDNLRRDIPATPEAEQWEGWGTALKPAHEPIVMARKPLAARTVAAQVLSTGTGAINIDACRIETADNLAGGTGSMLEAGGGRLDPSAYRQPVGRWPANVVLDEEAAEMLDAQSGRLAGRGNVSDGKVSRVRETPTGFAAGMLRGGAPHQTYDAGGGASRFFYCAKASKAERGADNTHPTVKPVALMRWLVRMVTPPGGIVLDPFAGSGTTLVAAQLEGFDALGIEQSAEYIEIIRRRLAGAET